ncbi:MAG: alanine racemase [Ignavibacteria bacterium]|nr:alanine racemase [Ignavibacteria bacterium]
MRATFAKVYIERLWHNFCRLKSKVGNRKIIAVVKANAYGHGLVEISRHLQNFGIDYLAVAYVSEGIELRRAGITAPILVLVPEDDVSVEASVDYNLDYAIDNLSVAQKISSYAKLRGKRAKVHIYVDTGMGRDGISPDYAFEFVKQCFALQNLEPIGIMSHFASSDSDRNYTLFQLNRFKRVIEELEYNGYKFELHHIANTGGVFSYPEALLDAVRPGIVLYGYLPSNSNNSNDFEPVMEIYSKVISTRKVRKGESVGYGRKFIAKVDTNVVTIPIGYGDGFWRHLSENLYCLINGKKYKVVGGICMDELMVDVGNDNINIGDEVVLLGTQGIHTISADELAKIGRTIIYEILTSLSTRVPRIYINNKH